MINRTIGGFGISNEFLHILIEEGSPFVRKEKFSENEGDLFAWGPWKHSYQHDPISPGVLEKDGFMFRVANDFTKEFRSDPHVVEICERLGDAAGGVHCVIRIVDIPFDSTKGWRIGSADDGHEYIAEGRTWAGEADDPQGDEE